MADIRRRLAAAARVFERGSSAGVLLAIALGWLVTLGTRFLVPAILPRIKNTFAMGNAEAGFAVTVIWACYALMQFPAGVLVDRIGEQRLLTASLVLAGASVGLLGGAPTVLVFLIACAAFGIGTGLYGPARGTALSKVFAPTPGRAFGIALAAGSVGSAALPFVGGVAAGSVGWRATLTVLAVPFIGLAAFAWRSVPDLRPDSGANRASVRAIPGAIANRQVIVAVLGLMLMLFVFQGLSAFLPTYLVEAKGIQEGTAAGLFALMFVVGAGIQALAGTAADRYGQRPVLYWTAGVSIFTAAALPFVEGLIPLGLLAAALGVRLAIAPVANSYVIGALPDRVTGSAWGFLRTAFFLVAATGSSFVGAMADAGLFDEAFLVLAGLGAVATGLFFLLPRGRPEQV